MLAAKAHDASAPFTPFYALCVILEDETALNSLARRANYAPIVVSHDSN